MKDLLPNPWQARFVTVAGVMVILALGVACGPESAPASSSESTPPTPRLAPFPATSPSPDDDDHEEEVNLVAAGNKLFVEKGCSACHGAGGIGTDIAPALPGHTELQVRRQTRSPIGIMPVFDPETISSDELNALVAYVTSLSGGHSHGSPGTTADLLMSHHVMAITALEGNNLAEAQHHIEHILGVVEGDHLSLMQHAAELVGESNTHEAQHLIESMVADVTPLDKDSGTLHLRLALSSLRIGDHDGADHHLEHALASEQRHDSAEVLKILDLLGSQDLVEAEEHLSMLVGVKAIGVEENNHDDDHDTEPVEGA